MPKGPQGQKRPADMIDNAVMFTGEDPAQAGQRTIMSFEEPLAAPAPLTTAITCKLLRAPPNIGSARNDSPQLVARQANLLFSLCALIIRK